MTAPSISIVELVTDADWVGLHEDWDDTLSNAAVARILEQLKLAGAQSAVVEQDYLDRDYSAEFSAFYGRLFRRYRRHARRFHFFKANLTTQATEGVAALVDLMEAASGSGDYLGFAVIRPVKDAPLGRVVLQWLEPLPGIDVRPQVRSSYQTHPLGARLSIRGLPFTQQDSRISACAQASIWMSGRHFNTHHGGPWCSTVAITEAASQPTDMTLATALPAGSSGLNVNNMLRALRSMDRYPYAFSASRVKLPNGDVGLIWPGALEPAAILARYVESGIPVIVGLRPWDTSPEGHAIVVLGDSFQPLANPVVAKSFPTIAEFSPYFLVHDDQRGPNLRMGVRQGLPYSDVPYNVQDHVEFIMVPLPDKVFIPGEAAERTAWDYLRFYRNEWPGLRAVHAAQIGGSALLGDAIVSAFDQGQVIARTYLTMGWKYKDRMLANTAAPAIRERVAAHELPRMVWVTELARIGDINHLDPKARRIFGHCVIDATSTGPYQPPLVFHAPGFLTIYNQNSGSFFVEASPDLFPLADDVLYNPRIRDI